ncbi:MAG: glutamate racemase [Victivallales bacterium]|nr:glutamate racemase [Victivallales bacterium]
MNTIATSPVGIFDSGLGGLTVASAFRTALPSENIVYLGDTARVPYGDKSKDTIIRFGIENATFMASLNTKMIIVACNTVSSIAMDHIRAAFPHIPIVGVLEAGVQAVMRRKTSKVAILGTRATIGSQAYLREIRKLSTERIEVVCIPCPLFTPIVEEGLANHEIGKMAVEFYLKDLISSPPDTLLLACTHYPLLKNQLESFLPKGVAILDSATTVARFAKEKLDELGMLNDSGGIGSERYFATDSPEIFNERAKEFLGYPTPAAEKACLKQKYA